MRMHPCFLLTPRSTIYENYDCCATGTDEGVRSYTINFPTAGMVAKKKP
jgi:hypothetical protein